VPRARQFGERVETGVSVDGELSTFLRTLLQAVFRIHTSISKPGY
jgi:hypothetical protein